MAVMVNVLTREDLDALADDGLRHELIDGAFVMTPAPGVAHQRALANLLAALRTACGDASLLVLCAPLDVVLGDNVVQPDVVVAPEGAFTERDLPTAPVLVVEIRSPSTAWLDDGRKRELYEEAGVQSYWLVDPITPTITVLELVDGRYTEVAQAVGAQTITVESPVPITLNPALLAQG